MQNYIFSAHYFDCSKRLIKVKASTRAKAYGIARNKAIQIKNDLDFVELN